MHFAFAVNARTLRKINLRFDKIETDYYRQINDLELEVHHLQPELDEQTAMGCHQRVKHTVRNTLLL